MLKHEAMAERRLSLYLKNQISFKHVASKESLKTFYTSMCQKKRHIGIRFQNLKNLIFVPLSGLPGPVLLIMKFLSKIWLRQNYICHIQEILKHA